MVFYDSKHVGLDTCIAETYKGQVLLTCHNEYLKLVGFGAYMAENITGPCQLKEHRIFFNNSSNQWVYLYGENFRSTSTLNIQWKSNDGSKILGEYAGLRPTIYGPNSIGFYPPLGIPDGVSVTVAVVENGGTIKSNAYSFMTGSPQASPVVKTHNLQEIKVRFDDPAADSKIVAQLKNEIPGASNFLFETILGPTLDGGSHGRTQRTSFSLPHDG